MRTGNRKGSVALLRVSFWMACGVSLCIVPAWGQQSQKVNEAIRPKDYPVKFDPKWGAGVARIGEGRLHQMDVTLLEIPPGKSLAPHRHLAEEVIYAVSGKGYTQMWLRDEEKEKKERYDWTEGDYLSPTVNAWHQHFNASPDTPARFVSITTAPLTENLFKSAGFLTSTEAVFEDRWKYSIVQKPQYFRTVKEGAASVRMRVGHLLPNLKNRAMEDRGEGMLGITISPEGDMAGNQLFEMEVREFKTGDSTSPEHRHAWETFYYILKGTGSSNLQLEDKAERKMDWAEGDLFIVEANEYHNHRPRGGPGGRFLQVKASGYFRRVGLKERGYLMQNKPGSTVRLR